MYASRSAVVFVAMLVASAASLASQGCQRAAMTMPSPHVASVSCASGTAIEIEGPQVVPPERLSSDDDGASVIHPCTAKTPSHDAARDALDAVNERIRSLPDDAPAKAVEDAKDELVSLLDTECFALSRADPNEGFDFDSAVALKAWWDDGGESWALHYLTIDASRQAVVPPTPRHTFTSLSTPSIAKAALSPLLCPPADARSTSASGCGHETMGWARRADRALARRAAANPQFWGRGGEPECAKEAEKADEALRFSTFRGCLDHVPPRRDALPLGRFKAPSDGWFVVKGAHSYRCTELDAYDLATGSAYQVSDCAGHGTPGVGVVTQAGKVPLPMLREAVWMVLLTSVVEERIRTEATTFDVPKGITITRPTDERQGRSGWGRCGGGSTPRAWTWLREKNGALVGQVSGTLRWPTSCDDAEDHAAELLGVTEAGIELGCSPPAAPGRIMWSMPGVLPHGGAPVTFDDPALAPARAALERAGTPTAARTPGKRQSCAKN